MDVSTSSWVIDIGLSRKADYYPYDCRTINLTYSKTNFYPISSIIRIFGSHYNERYELSKIKTCEYLMDAVFEIDNQRSIRDLSVEQHFFRNAAEIARTCQGWKVHFTLNKKDVVSSLSNLNGPIVLLN